jgi:hypothetical protein
MHISPLHLTSPHTPNQNTLVLRAQSGRYFYFNKKTGESIWEKPSIMGKETMDLRDEWAATQLQKMYRKKLARKHLADMSKQWYEKAYDPDSKDFYYVRKMDQSTRWDKPPFIAKNDDADLGPDSSKFLDRDDEIRHLKALLKEKERLIKHTEKARFAELDEKLRNERLLEAKQEPRGKQMDEWTMAEVVAWFESLGFPEYVPTLQTEREGAKEEATAQAQRRRESMQCRRRRESSARRRKRGSSARRRKRGSSARRRKRGSSARRSMRVSSARRRPASSAGAEDPASSAARRRAREQRRAQKSLRAAPRA